MSDNAEFLSSWRQQQTTTTTAGENVTSFFSSIGDSVSNSFNSAQNVLPLNISDITGSSSVEEPSWFQLSRFERIAGFFILIIGSFVCFALGFFLLPVLTLKPRKFVMLWTLGSLLFFLSFGVLQGPMAYIAHLSSKERLPFTVVFVSCVIGTLYSAVVLKSTILSLVMGIVEFMGVLWYTLSYFPFGAQTFAYIAGYVGTTATRMVGLS
ncbi:Sft2 protein [Martiniozyma asiatica (nom. inval.)]|nr:Sft2 protein [Martiniozyma asiatica]